MAAVFAAVTYAQHSNQPVLALAELLNVAPTRGTGKHIPDERNVSASMLSFDAESSGTAVPLLSASLMRKVRLLREWA